MYVIENIIGGQLLLNARDMRPPEKQRLPLTARHRHSVEAAATVNEAQAAVQARYSSSMDAVSSPSDCGVQRYRLTERRHQLLQTLTVLDLQMLGRRLNAHSPLMQFAQI